MKAGSFESYTVQFVLPVDNPENNVVRLMGRKGIRFEVPINLRNIHNLNLTELIALSQRRDLLTQSTDPNKKKVLTEDEE